MARTEFDTVLGGAPNQIERQRPDVVPSADNLLAVDLTGGDVTVEGLQTNVYVGLRYMASWLNGVGAAAINNLREAAATAEADGSLAMPPTQMPPPIGYICMAKDPDGNTIEFSYDQGIYATVQEVWG